MCRCCRCCCCCCLAIWVCSGLGRLSVCLSFFRLSLAALSSADFPIPTAVSASFVCSGPAVPVVVARPSPCAAAPATATAGSGHDSCLTLAVYSIFCSISYVQLCLFLISSIPCSFAPPHPSWGALLYYTECDKGRRCVHVATSRVAQIKSLWPGHDVTSQYFEPPCSNLVVVTDKVAGTAAAVASFASPAYSACTSLSLVLSLFPCF